MYCDCKEDESGDVSELCHVHKVACKNHHLKFLIWSMEHNAWWMPNERGYTPSREEAGRYSFEEACKIVKAANIGLSRGYQKNPHEAMIADTE